MMTLLFGIMYTIHHRVATSDVGPDRLMKVGSMGMLMQDCSTFQFEADPKFAACLQEYEMGVFMVSRQLDILRRPQYGEEIEIGKWVHACKGFYGLRNTTIRDAAGRLCVACFCVGAFVKRATGRPFVMPQSSYEDMLGGAPLEMEYLPRKIAVPAELDFKEIRRDYVEPGYMDANGHLNAGRSLDMAAACMDFPLKRVRVEYKAQGRPGVPFVVERADVAPAHSYVRLRSVEGEEFSVYEFVGEL